MRSILFVVVLLAIAGWALSRTGFLAWLHVEAEWGYFPDRPLVEFLEADRRMILLQDVTYVDPDGASIPQAFWSFVGGPFTGPYRDSAIIHDWHVEIMERTSEDTHRVFYYANRASGLSDFEAKRLYLAVLIGGRKWDGGDSSCYALCHTMPETYSVIDHELVLTPNVSEEDAAAAMLWLKASDRSFEELEEFVATQFPNSLFGHEGL